MKISTNSKFYFSFFNATFQNKVRKEKKKLPCVSIFQNMEFQSKDLYICTAELHLQPPKNE